MINFTFLANVRIVDDGGTGQTVSTGISKAVSTVANSSNINFISTNSNAPTKIIYDYISAFGGVIIAFAIIMAGIKILLSAHKKDAREKAMESLGKIIAGGFIIGSSLVFAGFIANIANQTGIEITAEAPGAGSPSFDTTDDDKGSFVLRAITDVVDIIPNKIFDWIGTGFGFQSLDKLIFNTSSSGTSMPPFSDSEWHNLNYLYINICTIVAPLLLIMVAKTGIEMVLYSDSTSKKIDLKEEISKWILCAFLLGTAPFLVQGLFRLFNAFTDSLGTATSAVWGTGGTSSSAAGKAFGVDTFENLKTGSALTTAIVHFLYAWQMVKINLVFISRKVVLAVMYAFTPIAIALWGINKRVHAASIWFGEILTNAAMQFFYAFTFTVMIVALGDDWKNWILTLVWMSAIIKIADMLRNSLQGFFTKLAGIDEAGLAGGVFGTVGSTFAGMAAAFGMAANNKEFKGSSVGGKVFGDALGTGNGKKDKTNGNGGTPANMPVSKDTPDVKSQNNSSPATGTSPIAGGTGNPSSSNGGINPSKGSSGSTPDVKSPNSSGTPTMSPDFTQDSDSGNSNESTGNPNDDLPPTIPTDSNDSTDVTNGEKSGSSNEGINPSQGSLNPTSNAKSSNNKSMKPADFKKKSNEQALYNSMLSDNINREMAKSSRRNASGITSGAMQAMTMNDPTMKGFVQGAGNIAAGIQKRRAVARAINKTADQMQQLSRGKMSKQQALTTLFGDSKVNYLQSNFKGFKVISNSNNKAANWANNKIADGVNGTVNRIREIGSNKQKFTGDIVKGNNEGAAMDLAAAHPFNKLSDDDKTTIIAQTNPYTSMDGFNHWDV